MIEESGEHMKLQVLEICLKDLHENFIQGAEIIVSDAVVSF
jgi:hypothetical protein